MGEHKLSKNRRGQAPPKLTAVEEARHRAPYYPTRITLTRDTGKLRVETTYDLHTDGKVYERASRGMPIRRVKDPEVIEAVHLRYHARRLERLAATKGWARPSVLDTHGDAPWVRYWLAMEERERILERDPEAQVGRPVPPHTPGGGLPACEHRNQRGKGDWMVCDDCGAWLEAS